MSEETKITPEDPKTFLESIGCKVTTFPEYTTSINLSSQSLDSDQREKFINLINHLKEFLKYSIIATPDVDISPDKVPYFDAKVHGDSSHPHVRRRKWRAKMAGEFGELFIKTYTPNKLRNNNLNLITTSCFFIKTMFGDLMTLESSASLNKIYTKSQEISKIDENLDKQAVDNRVISVTELDHMIRQFLDTLANGSAFKNPNSRL